MCFQGRSKFCLFCILLYSLIPHGILETKADGTEATTYSPIKDVLEPHSTDNTYQIKDTDSEVLDAEYYLDKMMVEYGNGTVMTFEGFEHFLHKLGLGKIRIFDHSIQCHKSNSSNFQSFHPTHNHSHVEQGPENSSTLCKHDANTVHHHGDVSSEHKDEHDNHEHSDTNNVHEHSDTGHEHSDTGHEHSDTGHEHSDTGHEHSDTGHDNGDKGPAEEEEHEHDHSVVENTTRYVHSKRSTEDPHKCETATVFLHIGKNPGSQFVTKDMFLNLCPSLIFQISEDTCHDYHPDHTGYQDNHEESDHVHHHDDMEHSHDGKGVPMTDALSGVPAKVWGYSTIAVVIISLVGLLGVAVIPIMQKVFYNHMLQFLVALAVGALSGDALLHLLPHAIGGGHSSEHGHSEHGHSDSEAEDAGHDHSVYKGLCGLLGIYFFYLVERVLTIVTDMKRRKKQHSRNRKVTGNEELARTGEKLAADCDEMMMSVHPNKALRGYADEAHSEHCMISFENTTSISHQHGKHKQSHDPEEHVDMLSHANGHGHGHGHSHCEDGAPNSIAAIAWMVILGDGIHNFSDGLAIGAAFSNSITGGFSTSIAVFCHELPHEIGDFAMLLRAGMAPKQAIIYNCLSSVLCFIGMLIGVAIGNIENASLWIFAIVGGMFLYIALVDMLPEMSSVDPKKGENPFCHLALQLLGMLLGGSIMLVIALYEDSLKNLLE